jgi:hypothetical protein
MYVSTGMWLLRRATGYGVRHAVLFALAVAACLSALTAIFWWIGVQAEALLGTAGAVLVALAYLPAALVLLAVALAVLIRLVAGRLRRAFGRPLWVP